MSYISSRPSDGTSRALSSALPSRLGQSQRPPRRGSCRHALWVLLSTTALLMLAACTHRVAVEPPKEPITINLNVKIDHEVRVKVEKDLEEVISEDSDLF